MTSRSWRWWGGLVAFYAVVLGAWWWFATSVAPPVLADRLANPGETLIDRAVHWYAAGQEPENVLKKWKNTTSGIAVGLICHFVLVAMIGVWHRRHATSRTAAQARFDRASSALLIVLSLAFFLVTALRGMIHDYFLFWQIWQEILKGNDPWFLVRGRAREYPLNAYGPLFTLLAPLTLVGRLTQKMLFAAAYWLYAAWMVKDVAPSRRFPAWGGLLLLLWLANPYAWIEIALFGHYDVLVGLLCIAAVECRLQERDYASAFWISAGTLLKYFPGVLVPFLMLDGRRIRVRFLVTTLILGALGMATAGLIWGPSVLRPLTFAATREPADLSIFRFLIGARSPVPNDLVFFTIDQIATPVLLATLAWLWTWTRRTGFETLASCVLAVTATLVLYKVGFPQYPMVLFVLGPYWFVRDHEALRRRPALIASFCAYFAWVGWFDVLIVKERTFSVSELAGLVTLALGGLLAASIVLASPPTDQPAPG
jgi:hypothetical protein